MRKLLAFLAAALVAASAVAVTPVPFFIGSTPGAGGIGADALIWELDATASDDITTANTKGPAVTVTRAGAGKTRVTSTGTLEELSANVLKRDHIGNGTEFMVAGFNVEEGRTNLVLQSEDLGTTWANLAATTPTLSTNTTTIGALDLDKLGDDSAVLAEGKSQTVTFTGDAVKVCSLFIKVGTSTSSVVRLRDTTALANRLLFAVTWSGGLPVVTMTTGTSEGVDKLSSGVFRIRVATTSVTAANTNSLELYPATDAALLGTPTGDVELGGFQCENGLFNTSWIPTTTGTVARANDVVTTATSGISGFNPDTLTMFAEAYKTGDTTNALRRLVALHDGTISNRHLITQRGDVGQVAMTVTNAGVAQVPSTSLGNYTGAATFKVALAEAANDFAGSLNGAAVVTDTGGTMPAVTTLSIGGGETGSTQFCAPILKLGLYNRRLSNSELELLTEPDPIWEWDAGQLSMTPIKGVGTPTVTRAANTATRVNESGLIEVVNANLPRFDYSPTSVGQLLGLLVEEARTNLLLRSAEFDTSWATTDTTVTPDVIASPDGGTNADLLTEGTAGTAVCSQSVTATADVNYAVSMFMKRGNHDWVLFRVLNSSNRFGAFVNLADGTFGNDNVNGTGALVSKSIQDYGNGWYRVTLVGSVGSGATGIIVRTQSATANGSATPVSNATRYLWGAQFENNAAFATSHIPTAGATATRAADVITLATASIPGFSASTLTMFAEAYQGAGTGGNSYVVELDDGTLDERHAILSGTLNTRARFFTRDGAVTQVDIQSAGGTWPADSLARIAYAVALNDAQPAVNGVLTSADAAVTMPALTTMRVGKSTTAGSELNAPIRNLRLYNYRAPDARLQRLTAP